MIVTCSSCQTRFRVSMDKCGPNGARVRCSRCNAIFVVRPPAAPSPPSPAPAYAGLDLDAAPPTFAPPRHANLDDPFGPSPPGPGESLAASLADERDPFAPLPAAPATATPDLEALLGVAPLAAPPPVGWGEIDLGAPPPTPLPIAPVAPVAPSRAARSAPPPLPPPTPAAPSRPASQLPPATPAPAATSVPAATPIPVLSASAQPAAAPPKRDARIRPAIEGSLSLVLLVALAAAIFLARGAGRGGGLAGLVRGAPVRAPDAEIAVKATSGLYDTAAGAPVVVVRGTVSARSPVEHPVRVAVELLEGGRAVSRGDALAGSLPTPEQVYAAGTPEGAAALRRAAEAGAVARLVPGTPAPFAVILAGLPPELRRVEVRATAEPAAERRAP